MATAASESRRVSRVQHVQEMRRNASRIKERGVNPPPIVVTEPGIGAPGPPSAHLYQHRALPKPPPASPKVASAKGGDFAYLHPLSAMERRFTHPIARVKQLGGIYQRSCPSTPVSRGMSSAGIALRAPRLHLDTRCQDIDYSCIEIAMEVAEETARICNSPGPVPTDVPLVCAGLSSRTVDDLNTWLLVRFNYRGPARRLMEEDITPEVLARDIIDRAPEFDISPDISGMIPIALGSACMTPVMCVPEDASAQLFSPKGTAARSPLRPTAPRRARTKKDLTLTLVPSPASARFPTPPTRSPAPPVPARRGAKAPPALDLGAPEPRSGKKAGFVVGLLAMGALLAGSPSTPRTLEHTPPDTAAPPSAFVPMDLPRTPFSASGFGGWYGVPRETPSSAARFLSFSPPAVHADRDGGGYAWFAQSPRERR